MMKPVLIFVLICGMHGVPLYVAAKPKNGLPKIEKQAQKLYEMFSSYRGDEEMPRGIVENLLNLHSEADLLKMLRRQVNRDDRNAGTIGECIARDVPVALEKVGTCAADKGYNNLHDYVEGLLQLRIE